MGGGLPSPTHSNAAGLYNGAVVNRSGPAESIRGETSVLFFRKNIKIEEFENFTLRNISYVFKAQSKDYAHFKLMILLQLLIICTI